MAATDKQGSMSAPDSGVAAPVAAEPQEDMFDMKKVPIVPTPHAALAGVMVLAMWLYGGGEEDSPVASTAHQLTLVVGILFPAFKTWKALATTDDQSDDLPMLIYWIAFNCIVVADSVLDMFFEGLPWFELFEFFVVLWLLLPFTNGARIVFTHVIAPFIVKHHARADEEMKKAEEKFSWAKVLLGNAAFMGALPLVFFFLPSAVTSLGVVVAGVAYPVLKSFYALANRDAEQVEIWLTYFLCFSCLIVFPRLFLDWILEWIPLYHNAELAAAVWMWFPLTRGARIIYERVFDHVHGKDSGVDNKKKA